MGLPSSLEARPYYRAALQRFQDAKFLLSGSRTTGAMYMAGYSVECMLKAMILSVVPRKRRWGVLALISGKAEKKARPHDFDWLKQQYLSNGGASFSAVNRDFIRVSTWSTAIRYESRTMRARDACAFLDAAHRIIQWADGRL